MKKVFVLPVFILFIGVFSSCTLFTEAESPSKVVENFFTYFFNGEIRKASEVCYKFQYEMTDEERDDYVVRGEGAYEAEFSRKNPWVDFVILDEKIDGNSAIVDFKIIEADNHVDERSVELVKVREENFFKRTFIKAYTWLIAE
ncbi:MAG: hypothetical protein R3Y22_01885 [Bacteroidales bacterium]